MNHGIRNELEQSGSDPGAHRDPLTGAPGSHPVGTGAGAAAGGVTGAAAGTMLGGPLGAVVGATVGAVAGGLLGKGAAELVDPTAEDAYWREHYSNENFYEAGRSYDYYAPGYRTGYEGRARYNGKQFDDVEDDLAADYARHRDAASPEWDDAREPARSAWERVDRALIGTP